MIIRNPLAVNVLHKSRSFYTPPIVGSYQGTRLRPGNSAPIASPLPPMRAGNGLFTRRRSCAGPRPPSPPERDRRRVVPRTRIREPRGLTRAPPPRTTPPAEKTLDALRPNPQSLPTYSNDHMKIYTVLVNRDPAALQQFAQTCKDCGATGVTIFTRPALVAYTPPPGTPTPEALRQQADAAAAAKDYRRAAELQQLAENAAQDLKDMAAQGAEWIKKEIESIRQITQLVVLGDLNWPQGTPWTPPNFLAQMDAISGLLTTTGIGGIVQQTPLARRTYVPLAPPSPQTSVAGGTATQGEPAGAGGLAVETPARHPADHPSLPRTLSPKQSEYAAHRLGLDRGGARRSKQEAGNLMGWSPHIAAKIENEIARVWPEFADKVNGNEPTPAPEPSLA